MSYTIPSGQWAKFQIGGLNQGGSPINLTAIAASIPSTVDCYIAKFTDEILAVVPRSAVSGGPVLSADTDIEVTVSGVNDAGQALTPLVLSITLQAPPPPPPPTDSLTIVTVNIVTGSVPADPGVNSIALKP